MNDQKQRDQALNIESSFIVQAPAGSGKTELITQRYLKLLGSSEEPENILVMTFTNRAVDELKLRIVSALSNAQVEPPKEPHKLITYNLALRVLNQSKKRNWDLLRHPSRLKVITIDSLSNLIVSRFPSLDQLIPHRTIIDSYEYEFIYRQAAENTLLLINDDEYKSSVSSVLLSLDNHVDRFYRLIEEMLAKREQWLPRLFIDGALDISSLESISKTLITDYLEDLRGIAQNPLGDNFFSLLKVSKREDISQISKLPGSSIKDLKDWRAIADILITKSSKNWRKKIDVTIGFPAEMKDEKNQLRKFIDGLYSEFELKKLLINLHNLPSEHFPEFTKKYITDIAQVLKLSVAELKVIFDEKGLQDFSEVSLQAINALDTREELTDIALLLDYQIKHVLVDEFQDTSYSQLNLIQKLVEDWQQDDGKTIFFVGDPMQSIYKFRESQVGIFLEVVRSGIANLDIKPLILSTNFRSTQSIVRENNEIFANIFPNEDNLILGSIHYSKSTPFSKEEQKNAISFYVFSPNQDQEEAEEIVKIIKQSLLRNQEKEIAVLVRSRSHLSQVSSALQKNNINFESLKTESLRSNLFTRDLLSLTRALLSLSDKLAWLSILRAPWCGLKLKDLLALSKTSDQTIFKQLMNVESVQNLSDDGIKRAQHIFLATKEAIFSEGKFTFVERFSFVLEMLYKDHYLEEQEKNIKTQFLKLLNHCESNQVLNIKTIESMLQDLYAPSRSSNLKLMTIHQAKGLEFDIVIIPGLGKKGRNDNLPLMQMQEFSDNHVLLAPIKPTDEDSESETYLYLQYLKKQQSHFELMRLLYVAMSRAKQEVHLLGALSKSGKPTTGSFLSLLSDYYEDNVIHINSQNESSLEIEQPPKLLRNKILMPPLVRKQNYVDGLNNSPKAFDLIYQGALGTIVHFYLEHAEFNPSSLSVDTMLRERGVPSRLLNSLSDTILSLLKNTKRDKNFEWIFKYRESTEVESEFSNSTQTIIVDRLFVEDGVLWIIDFKTSSLHEGENINAFIERQKNAHQGQIENYKGVLEEFFQLPSKSALYCPAASQLIFL
ncbi:UvrD-helicase domain-containing protein [Candidatus Pseudothioglobus singularis]|nr:UvrD-helicase domain-containing protein [Candidatus Pseudothioglobus singularis]